MTAHVQPTTQGCCSRCCLYSIPQVLLRTGPDGSPLVYACSWWNAEIVSLGAACMESFAR